MNKPDSGRQPLVDHQEVGSHLHVAYQKTAAIVPRYA